MLHSINNNKKRIHDYSILFLSLLTFRFPYTFGSNQQGRVRKLDHSKKKQNRIFIVFVLFITSISSTKYGLYRRHMQMFDHSHLSLWL